MSSRSWARHPVGFYLLCFIELCERFAGSLLGSLLLLYLNERHGMTPGAATRLGGAYQGSVYGAAVLGGVVADRFLGTRWAILIGAALLALGYALLSTDRASALYPAAVLLILGHALFKPNISAAVGKLYERGDRRQEDAYSLFYVVFNVGVMLGPLAGSALRATSGWSMAFGAAALGMAVALAASVVSYRWLQATELKTERAGTEQSALHSTSAWTLPTVARLLVAVLLFTATYGQSGHSLLFWARDCTRRSLFGHVVQPSAVLAVPGALVLTLQPLLTWLLAALARRGYEPSQLTRIRAGILCSAAAYLLMTGAATVQGRSDTAVSMLWLVGCLFGLTLGELLVYPVSTALLTRLAPLNLTAAATGLWLMAFAVGQWLAGEAAARWTVFSHAQFFAGLACLSLVACAALPGQAGRSRPPRSP